MGLIDSYKNIPENKRSILRTVYQEQEVSRNYLVEKLKLSPATVTKFVAELIDEGIIEESGEMESTGGRKPVILRVVPDYTYILGVDIGSCMTRTAVLKVNGEIVEKEEFRSDGFDIDKLVEKLHSLKRKYRDKRIMGIGIGVSGMVDYDKGEIIFCPNIKQFNGLKIKSILERELDIYTKVDTSSRCMALAEQWFGIGKGIANQIFVSIGYGIGAGIIVDSKVFRGNSGFAGELGHIQVEEDDNRCTCGNYGCLENYATLPLIVLFVKRKLAKYEGYSPLKMMIEDVDVVNKHHLVEALKKGDKIVYEEITNTGRLIGVALANMANIINPKLIILGGGVIETFPDIIDSVKRTVMERSLTPIHQDLNVVRSSLGWDAAIIGSAVLVVSDFLK